MKNITKFFTAVCVLSSLALCAEVTNFDSTMWKYFTSRPKFEGTKITAMTNVGLNSKKTFTAEEGKTYTLSMDVKRVSESEKNPTILFGFEGLSKEGKPLPVYSYQFIPNTFTEVVADAKAGDTTLVIKDGKKWRGKSSDYRVVADAQEDLSDLPNTNTIGNGVKSVVKDGENYVITLFKPLQKDIAKGTKIREHLAGGYFYVNPSVKINTDNVYRVKGVITGINKNGIMSKTKGFPYGVPQWRIVILANWNRSKSGLELDNITFTAE